MRVLFADVVISAVLALAVSGCGGPNADVPELAPVSGKVTLNGQPASGVTVMFIPAGSTKGRASYGTADESGRYELMYDQDHKGTPVGEYKVIFSKMVAPDGSDLPAGAVPADMGAVEKLPPKYSSEELTQEKATVPSGGGTFDFDLKTSG